MNRDRLQIRHLHTPTARLCSPGMGTGSLVAILLATTTASAGGLSRPNGISARGVGMGGAWAAWVDDATAVVFNPAAMSGIDPQVQAGGELVIGPRSYTPPGEPAQTTTVVAPVPVVGAIGRFSDNDRPSAFTLGVGLWNTFGGKIHYDKKTAMAFDTVQDAVLEATAGAALRLSDKLSVGAAVRVGIGLFDVVATEYPYNAELSASGAGVGATFGILFEPTPRVRIAASYRTPLRITTTGTGTIELPGGTAQVDVTHEQTWPQTATFGLGLLATPRVKLAAQLDWTAWSMVDRIVVSASGIPDIAFVENWRDNYTIRAGAALAATDAITVRAGAYVDTNAVPDRAIERQYLDGQKVGLATGASVTHGRFRIDAAADAVLSAPREVPDDGTNIAPGTHEGTLVTFELSAAYFF